MQNKDATGTTRVTVPFATLPTRHDRPAGPWSCIKVIGLDPKGQRVYGSADSRETALAFALAHIKFMGDMATERISIGDEGIEPVLGVMALKSTRLPVQPGPFAARPASFLYDERGGLEFGHTTCPFQRGYDRSTRSRGRGGEVSISRGQARLFIARFSSPMEEEGNPRDERVVALPADNGHAPHPRRRSRTVRITRSGDDPAGCPRRAFP